MTLILAVVLILGGLTLYRAGRMTADKMELQNAADAMAFGVSTVEARDLNFAAYTNRAIIANEVAIGQAIGMRRGLITGNPSAISCLNTINSCPARRSASPIRYCRRWPRPSRSRAASS